MKIIHSVRELRPGGGVCGVAHGLAEEFRRQGQEVGSFTIGDCGLSRSQHKFANLYLQKLVLFFDILYFTTVGTLLSMIRHRRHAVITHNDSLHGQVYVNHGLHHAMMVASGHPWRMLLRNPVHIVIHVRDWLRFNLRMHRAYVCFSESEKALMLRYYPRLEGRIHIIPNGVALDRFKPDPEARQRLRRDMNLEDCFVLVFVGHEYERKGLKPILDALPELPDCVRLLVVGGTRQEMEAGEAWAASRKVSSRVIFLGVRSDVPQLMCAADAMILPSKFESWALVGLEALACGTPVLMTDTGGIPDYLSEGHNGLFIEPEPGSIRDAVARLLGDRALHASMKASARDSVLRFSWATVARDYIRLVHETCT